MNNRPHLTLVGGHQEEVEALLRKNDHSYDDAVTRRNFFEQAAGKHLRRMVEVYAGRDDFTPNSALRSLLNDYEHLARGYSLRNGASSTCDCPGDRDFHFRGRCTGCGAGLSLEFLKWRTDVEQTGGVA